MLVTVVAVVVGLVVGVLLPARVARFARAKLRWAPLLVVGVVLTAVGSRIDDNTGLAIMLAGYGTLIVGAAINAHLVGMGILLVGLSANALVMGLNSGMPVRASALVTADVVNADEVSTITLDGHRHVESADDKLAILDDRIPIAGQVVSVGDLILGVGLAYAVAHLVRRRRSRALDTPAANGEPPGLGPAKARSGPRHAVSSSTRPVHD
jgi:hypothetical protein